MKGLLIALSVTAFACATLACTTDASGGKKDVSDTSGWIYPDTGPEPTDAVETDDTDGADSSSAEDVPSVPEVESPDIVVPEELPPIEPDVPDLTEPDAGPLPLNDGDGDGVPDISDYFPADPNLPGTVTAGKVYAQTATTLFTMDVKTYKIVEIGDFDWQGTGGLLTPKMTDIAIDRYGVLYGVAYAEMYTCHPDTVVCTHLGTLPEEFNAMTWIPAGILDAEADVLVGVAGSNWYRLDRNGSIYDATLLGAYGGVYTSSGDVYSIAGIGTFGTVNKPPSKDDFVVSIDPKTGKVIKEVGQMFGFSSMFGVAGWNDRAFAFDSSGRIAIVDIDDGTILKEIADTEQKWWGAAVSTVIPPEP